ncbi:hypothetical protein FN846DRAFT_910947 [Sphaerosporella brunnea]|uniref:Uncharacterized protein n=1 Tax=Sphaerosporella brunnea TaxID=1250544 RepID=A0A5J5ELS3_9PEZI|nr:hypothetical protein FN846DRAFT_910947 [Sphaerosporella brunnea]
MLRRVFNRAPPPPPPGPDRMLADRAHLNYAIIYNRTTSWWSRVIEWKRKTTPKAATVKREYRSAIALAMALIVHLDETVYDISRYLYVRDYEQKDLSDEEHKAAIAMVEKWSVAEPLTDEFYFLPEEDEEIGSMEHFRWVVDEMRRYLAAAGKENIAASKHSAQQKSQSPGPISVEDINMIVNSANSTINAAARKTRRRNVPHPKTKNKETDEGEDTETSILIWKIGTAAGRAGWMTKCTRSRVRQVGQQQCSGEVEEEEHEEEEDFVSLQAEVEAPSSGLSSPCK